MKLQTVVVHSVRRVVIGTIAVALVALAIQLSADAADNQNTSCTKLSPSDLGQERPQKRCK
jgi:hypothetical protein